MPINIYTIETKKCVAWLCDGNWVLIEQFNELEKWVNDNYKLLDPSKSYMADIGFSANYNAMAGGPAFHIEFMKKLIALNINVCISEYPPLTIGEKAAQQVDSAEAATND